MTTLSLPHLPLRHLELALPVLREGRKSEKSVNTVWLLKLTCS